MKRKLLFAATLIAGLLGGISTASAQENIIKDWDGGENTGLPTTFGWESNKSDRTWGALNGAGSRFSTSWTDNYVLEDGTAYPKGSIILWLKHNNDLQEVYTYTFKGLTAGKSYRFSGLVAWHNNGAGNVFGISVEGQTTFHTAEVSTPDRLKLYNVSFAFDVPEDDQSEEFKLNFYLKSATTKNENMETLSALSITEIPELEVAQQKLADAIAAANVPTVNVGDKAFQFPTAKVEALKTALANAEELTESTETEAIKTAVKALEDAIAGLEINAPTAERYTLQNIPGNWSTFVRETDSSKGWYGVNFSDFEGAYLTFVKGGRDDQGNYAVNIGVVSSAKNSVAKGYKQNDAYAQAFKFEKAEGLNKYYISQTDDDGTARYLTTALKGYNAGSDQQIRTTTAKENAYAFTIVPTSEEGVYNIYVEGAGQNIDFQDAGAFAANYGHASFAIVEAKKASVSISVGADKYATAIFPFAPTLPEGVVANTIKEIDEDGIITLEEVAEPVANVPYILSAETDVTETVEGFGTAKQDTYASGNLTGVYTEDAVPAGSYVLQTQEGVQAFYQVAEESTLTAVPYRAYLTVGDATVKAFHFGTNSDATAIKGVETVAEGAEKAVIYNLAGQRVVNPTKGGIYIVNGQKVLVK